MNAAPEEPDIASRTVPLRARLLRIAIAGILPLALIAGVGLMTIVHDQQVDAERNTLDVTRLSAAAIDLEVSRSIATLRMLAELPLLDGGDLSGFEGVLRRVQATLPGWHGLVLATPDARVLVNTETAGAVVIERETFDEVVRTGDIKVGHIAQGPDGRWGLPIRVPVFRDGELKYVLTAVLAPETLVEVLRAQRLPESWVTSIFDARGVRIARSHRHEQEIGKRPTPSMARLMAGDSADGMGVTRTIEGAAAYTAFVRLPVSGWVVAVGIPTETVGAGVIRAFVAYGSGLLLSLLLAIGAALLATRRINEPMRELRRAAKLIGIGQVPRLPRSDIQEVQEVGKALLESAAAHRRSSAERDALLSELENQVDDMRRLQELTNELIKLPTLRSQLQATLKALCEFHGAQHGLVTRYVGNEGRRLIEAYMGLSDASVGQLSGMLSEARARGLLLLDERRMIVEDIEHDPRVAAFAGIARAEGFRSSHSTPVFGSSGQLIGVISVYLVEPRAPTEQEMRLADLCCQLAAVFIERARVEAEAGESEQRLRVALDSSTVPFNVMAPVRDEEGRIVDFAWDYVNRASARALGLSPLQVLKRRVSELFPSDWERPELFEAYCAVAERQEVRDFELHAIENGVEGWFHVVATPFENRVAVWYADITERKKHEQALQEADRRKDQFLATLAHELRNPLAPIRQAAMISGAPQATDAQKRWSQEVIDRQVRHMALLLDDLLDVSRITRGRLSLRKSSIELRSVLDAALETTRPLIESKRHQLTLSVPPQAIVLEADPLRFAQIVANLLTNAAKYTDAGGVIRLEARLEAGQVVVEVQDNGIGIAPQDIGSIFEMFSQLRAGDGRSDGGLGIGLALARGLAQLHGGDVSASSEGPGRGSRFTVSLPLGETATATAPDRPADSAAAATPRRVLIADDNRDAAESLADLLRLAGHEVAVAYDGEAALSLYQRFHPQVAVLDIGMPKLGGHELALAIRETERGRDTLLIAATGWGQGKDKAQALLAGFDHHMTKPIDPKLLLRMLTDRS